MSNKEICYQCLGKGWCKVEGIAGATSHTETCNECNGMGKIDVDRIKDIKKYRKYLIDNGVTFEKSIKIANPDLNEYIRELITEADKIVEVKVTYIPKEV